MKLLKRLLPYVVALAIVALLLWQIDPLEVLRLLAGADLRWVLVGFGAFVVTNILRAYRFGVLLDWRGPADEGAADRPANRPITILPEMFALSFFNTILPSRSGELSFPYFMWRRHGVAVGESTAALIVVRIFDYLAVGLLYVVFAWLERQKLTPGAAQVVQIVAILLLLSMILLAAAPWLGRVGLRLAAWLLDRFGLAAGRPGQMLLRSGRRAVSAFERMRTLRSYGLTLGWSLLTWLLTFAWFAAFMVAIGLPTPFTLVVVGSTFGVLAKALPFVTVGGFGAHEAGWAVGFGLVGMETGLAIASGFAVNILTVTASAVFGVGALIFMRWQERTEGQRDRGAEDRKIRGAEKETRDNPDLGVEALSLPAVAAATDTEGGR